MCLDSSLTDSTQIETRITNRPSYGINSKPRLSKAINNVSINPIETLIRPRYMTKQKSAVPEQKQCGANFKNLIPVPTIKLPKLFEHGALRIAIQNVRSVRNKTNFLRDFIIENKLDIFGITESWLRDDERHIIGNILPDGYSFYSVPRREGKGGGVLLLFKSNLKIKFEDQNFTTFENIQCSIVRDKTYHFCLIYRPPPNPKNGFTNDKFISEFSQQISDLLIRPSEFVITGDFNIHLDNNEAPLTYEFNGLLESFGLHHLVSEPTHDAGHCLDTIITRKDAALVLCPQVIDTGISDHRAITFNITAPTTENIRKTISKRDLTKCKIPDVQHDISMINIDLSDINTAIDSYNTQLKPIMDKHAPSITKTITVRPNTKWYNSNIRKAKVVKRRLERRFRKSGIEADKLAYKKQCEYINYLMKEAKTKFFSNKICETKNDKKKLFGIAKEILYWKNEPVYPDIPPDKLPFDFAKFFTDKIVKINDEITAESAKFLEDEIQDIVNVNCELNNFEPVTVSEIELLLSKTSSASCELDPMHTILIKACKNEIAPIITNIVNLSLAGQEVPISLKNAVVRPLLKKASLDPNNFKHFRPVSNLPFISKITEKVVAKQLKNYLDFNSLMEVNQSAYKMFHSTETALLRVHNGITHALDNKKMVVLLLLDLSAAFDTISHNLLLKRLDSRFGIRSHALNWIKSYLSNRTQYVTVNNITSDPQQLSTGVPQGSVLGPILFTLYVSPLGDLTQKHDINSHFYADDTQLYLSFKPCADNSIYIKKLENCVLDIKNWMRQNYLKLNEEKTEILLLGSSLLLQKLSNVLVKVGDIAIKSGNLVKNLGAIFDSRLTMDNFVSYKCKTASYYLRCISHIRPFLDTDSTKTLIHALVTSRLDYANSLLLGISKTQLHRLQVIQNSAARLIFKINKRTHITPIIRSLHWLPIDHRVQFKILVICFNCINGTAPAYLSQLVRPYTPSRELRSSHENFLHVPFTRTKVYSSKCFSIAAPTLWNKLPSNIRNCVNIERFKSLLKTFLFKLAYNC